MERRLEKIDYISPRADVVQLLARRQLMLVFSYPAEIDADFDAIDDLGDWKEVE